MLTVEKAAVMPTFLSTGIRLPKKAHVGLAVSSQTDFLTYVHTTS